jgi:hypothetical protein
VSLKVLSPTDTKKSKQKYCVYHKRHTITFIGFKRDLSLYIEMASAAVRIQPLELMVGLLDVVSFHLE